jgi:hypothetical protein
MLKWGTGEVCGIIRGGALGDTWSCCSYILQREYKPRLNPCTMGRDYRGLVGLISSLLDTRNGFEYVEGEPKYVPSHFSCYQHDYVPTKSKWSGGGSGKICYQFDGRSEGEDKNLSKEEEGELLDIWGRGYGVENLGGMRNLGEVVELMSGSELFVGIPSGMSHVAHSVGIPTVIILTEAMLKKYGGFGYYRQSVYCNKRNMVFYRGVRSLMVDSDFVINFGRNRGKLLEGQ